MPKYKTPIRCAFAQREIKRLQYQTVTELRATVSELGSALDESAEEQKSLDSNHGKLDRLHEQAKAMLQRRDDRGDS